MVKFRVDGRKSTPLVQQIQEGFRTRIDDGEMPPGTRLPSIREMSRIFGCSAGSVERAMIGLASDRYLTSVPRRGFFVADEPGGPPPTTDVALVLPSLRLEAMAAMIRGVRAAVAATGFRLFIQAADDSYEDQLHLLKYLAHTDLAGVIIVPPISDAYAEPIREFARHTEAPVVLSPQVLEGCGDLASVCVDNAECGRMAISHLLDRGHRQIAVIGHHTASLASREVAEGVEAGLDDAGMVFDDLVPIPVDVLDLNTSEPWKHAAEAMTGFLAGDRQGVTAVLGWSHYPTLGAARALREAGVSVPSEVSLLSMGFDVEAFGLNDPPITVVHRPLEAVAERAGRRLLQMIKERDDTPQQIRLHPQFIERGSVAPPSGG